MKTGLLVSLFGAGIGAIGGGTLLANHFFLKNSIRDILIEKKHTFLSFKKGEDLDAWKTIAKAYSASTKNRLGDLKITIPTSTTQQVTSQNADDLKNTCNTLINNKNYTKSILLAAEQWCVKPITIKDLISHHRKTISLDVSKDDAAEEWETKVNAYFENGAKNKIQNTTLTSKSTSDKVGDRKKLKTDCNTLTSKNTYDIDFHESYASFNDWCTIPK